MLRELIPSLTAAQERRLLDASDNNPDRAIEFYYNGFLDLPNDPIIDDGVFQAPRATGTVAKSCASSSPFAKPTKSTTPTKTVKTITTTKKAAKPVKKPVKKRVGKVVVPCTLVTPSKAKCLSISTTRQALELQSDSLLSPREIDQSSLFAIASVYEGDKIEEEGGIFDEIQAVYVQKCVEAENELVSKITLLKRSHLEKV
jgi:hypothetical protein